MEIIQAKRKTGAKLKFAGLHLVSVALVIFIVSMFWPRTTPTGVVTAANPLDANYGLDVNDLLSKVEMLNNQYKKLKNLDLEFISQTDASKDLDVLNSFRQPVIEAEATLNNTIDNLAKTARATTDPKQALRLQNFIESFRLVLADRSAMNAYKTAILSSGNANAGQQAIVKFQADLATGYNRIAALETHLRTLEVSSNSKPASNAANTTASQQNIDALKTTVAMQEKKIASLTAANTALEKEKSSMDTESAKKGADNSTFLKNQNTMLEKKINELNADLRFALVDCNLTRADATQIISNSKQRKTLLAETLGILKSEAAIGDATIKSKVTEKLARLNMVASTMHD